MAKIAEMTLADHCEAWARERDMEVPARGTRAWEELYHEWVEWAFREFGSF